MMVSVMNTRILHVLINACETAMANTITAYLPFDLFDMVLPMMYNVFNV